MVPRSLLLSVQISFLALGITLAPGAAQATNDPDPVNAVVLSSIATVLPVGMATGLLTTGRGADEGIRFDLALILMSLGSAIGPSAGQFYAKGGTNAWVTLGLRLITTGTMSTGLALSLRGAEDQQTLGDALFWVGLIPTAALALYDIITAYDRAKESKYRNAPIARLVVPADLVSVAICGPVPCDISKRL